MYSNRATNSELEKETEEVSEDTLIRPRFDTGAIRQAKAAVPVNVEGRRKRSRVVFVVAIIAGILGGIMGSILTINYLNNNTPQVLQAQGRSGTAETPQQGEPGPGGIAPAPDQKQEEAAALDKSQAEKENEAPGLTTPIPPRDLQAEESEEARAEETDPQESAKDEEGLRQSFHSWLQATRQRDIDKQMGFYNSKVNRYYLARGASQEDVRAEKEQVFGRARVVNIDVSEPQVRLSPDGNQATIRFRKRYIIEGEEGERVNRRGEVIQELRWRRINGQWRIVGERDLKVLR